MDCPVCSRDSRVIRTDDTDRRRECTACGHRFTTTEVLKDDLDRAKRIALDARALADLIEASG